MELLTIQRSEGAVSEQSKPESAYSIAAQEERAPVYEEWVVGLLHHRRDNRWQRLRCQFVETCSRARVS